MKNYLQVITWATDCLLAQGYSLSSSPEVIVETPWSLVMRFSTSKAVFYLKQTPPSLFLESKITQWLAKQFQASVPTIIASNDELFCFLMNDAGQSLRQTLKTEFQSEWLLEAIQQYTTLQRSTENHIESFLRLGVPDWRLEKLPSLYDQLINQTVLLKADGMTEKELELLAHLSLRISEQCKLLAQYQIPETLVQPDFHTNNILFDPNTKKMTFIDLGEIVISHPFFSLHNFLYQASLHHNVKEQDQSYDQLQNACYKNWLDLATKAQRQDAFTLIKKLWPIYSALALYRLMTSVDMNAFKTYYADRPHRLAGYLREYLREVS